MNPQTKFFTDLALAHNLESVVAMALSRYGEAWFNPKNNGDYDIGFYNQKTGLQALLETKMDWRSLESWNHYLEPQTLSHSKADYVLLARPDVTVLTIQQAKEMYLKYPKKIGGEQGLQGAVIPCKDVWNEGTPFYKFIKTL
jgi:hypothetical protein